MKRKVRLFFSFFFLSRMVDKLLNSSYIVCLLTFTVGAVLGQVQSVKVSSTGGTNQANGLFVTLLQANTNAPFLMPWYQR